MRLVGNGRYELTERIAAGGMGEVWKGQDTALGRVVAVKLLHSNLADDARFRARFESEARNAAALHDPTIATIFDYGDDVDPASGSHTAYLVMEYVDGVAMSALLTQPLPAERAAFLIAQVADGLAVAHAAGIVHRDVKPANFVVLADDRVKITDFGIARALGATALTDSGTIMGTPHYVAPEVAEGRDATPASDIYSLGVVLYECLSGRRPFAGEAPVAVVLSHLRDQPPPLPASVPPLLRSLVESAMAKDPAMRPPSAEQFAAALRSAVAESPGVAVGAAVAATAVLPGGASSTRVLTTPLLAAEPGETRRWWWPLVATAAAMLIVGGIIWTFNSDQDSGSGPRDPSALAGAGSEAATEPSPSQPAATSPQQTTSTRTRQTPPPSTAATDEPPAAVHGADYVGMTADEAEDALKARFEVKKETASGGTEGVVADVSPPGVLTPGMEVTLFVYDGKSSDDSDEDPGKGDENGKGEDPGNDKNGAADENGKGEDPGNDKNGAADENGKGEDPGKGGR